MAKNSTTQQILIIDAIETIEFFMGYGYSLRRSYAFWSNSVHAGSAVHEVVCGHFGIEWKEPGRRVSR